MPSRFAKRTTKAGGIGSPATLPPTEGGHTKARERASLLCTPLRSAMVRKRRDKARRPLLNSATGIPTHARNGSAYKTAMSMGADAFQIATTTTGSARWKGAPTAQPARLTACGPDGRTTLEPRPRTKSEPPTM